MAQQNTQLNPKGDSSGVQILLNQLVNIEQQSSKNAVQTLYKTIQSHNITYEDWNKIVTFVSNNKNYLDKIYTNVPEAIATAYNDLIAYIDSHDSNHLVATDIFINFAED